MIIKLEQKHGSVVSPAWMGSMLRVMSRDLGQCRSDPRARAPSSRRILSKCSKLFPRCNACKGEHVPTRSSQRMTAGSCDEPN